MSSTRISNKAPGLRTRFHSVSAGNILLRGMYSKRCCATIKSTESFAKPALRLAASVTISMPGRFLISMFTKLERLSSPLPKFKRTTDLHLLSVLFHVPECSVFAFVVFFCMGSLPQYINIRRVVKIYLLLHRDSAVRDCS